MAAEKGDLDKSRNYDDFNEFFWSGDCLTYSYADAAYFTEAHKESKARDWRGAQTVAMALKISPKTYLERRSWLHPLRILQRMLSVLFVFFHLLVAIAFLDFTDHYLLDAYSNKVMSSVVLSIAFWSLVKEFLELWANFGIISLSIQLTAGFILRFCIKSLSFLYLALFYIWSFERTESYWHAYLIISAIYLLPWAGLLIAALFPSLSTWTRNQRILCFSWFTELWWPQNRLLVGDKVHEKAGSTYLYQAFWITLGAWKLFCSYHFQVYPLVQPTLHLIGSNSLLEIPLLHIALIILLWVPFIFVYLLDPLIWYHVWQAVVGAYVGMMSKLGQVRDFPALSEIFTLAPAEFDKKLVIKKLAKSKRRRGGARPMEDDDGENVGVSLLRKGPGKRRRGPYSQSSSDDTPGIGQNDGDELKVPNGDFDEELGREIDIERGDAENKGERGFYSYQWRQFSLAWNEIIADIRSADLISNAEAYLLQFRYVEHGEKQYYLPLFLTAGLLDRAVEQCQFYYTKYKSAEDAVERKRVEKGLSEFFFEAQLTREAVTEVWELVRWLLQNLLGQKDEYELEDIFAQLLALLRKGLLADINMDKIHELKPNLLNLVRGLRISIRWAKEEHTKFQTEKSMQTKSDGEVKQSKKRRKSKDTIEEESFTKSLQRAKEIRVHQHLFKSASRGTLLVLEQIGNRRAATNLTSSRFAQTLPLHVDLLREQLRKFLSSLGTILQGMKESGEGAPSVSARIKNITTNEKGFLWDDEYAFKQLATLLESPRIENLVETLHKYLTVAKIDAQPNSGDAQRRLLFWINSLFMDIPTPPPVRNMSSWTVLTPFYSEDVMYSFADLEKETQHGFSTFFYLQTIYPKQWKNFLERIGVETDNPHDPAILQGDTVKINKARMWATRRGQTLFRTVEGMMLYEKALLLLAQLEQPDQDTDDLRQLVKQKFQYIISCQVYGKQKREMDPKANDIEYLLSNYPNLRVAYIDSTKVKKTDKNGKAVIVEEFYSVLIKAVKTAKGHEIREIFRIKLPGNPLLGEGKPENQNHAIIFSRGEYIQAIDMNQDNYFEEALKARNLLQEFESHDGKPVGIVGFREQIFTGSLSSVANYMALQESCFVTLGQRVLASPLRIRLHYGHPDLFDKLFFMGRGGISKASRGINLSEDIFAGFNTVLRGGEILFREYIQVGKGRDVGLQQLFKFEAKLAQGAAMQSLSRDVYRLANSLDIFRLFSYFYGQLGYYLTNSLTIWALTLFLYARTIIAALGFEETYAFNKTATISYWFGQIGFLLTLPIYASLSLEKGFRQGTIDVIRMIASGGPIYFMFHMGTKAHFFEQTMISGGASYRATGRGFVTKHEPFAEMFRFFAFSHFYKAVELGILMILYAFLKTTNQTYAAVTWAGWLVIGSWLFAPLWFNPMSFEWSKVIADANDFRRWITRDEGTSEESWKSWFREETYYLKSLALGWRTLLSVAALRYVVVGLCLLHFSGTELQELGVEASILALGIIIIVILRQRFSVENQLEVRALKVALVLILICSSIIFLALYSITPILNAVVPMIALLYFGHAVASVCYLWGAQWKFLYKLWQTYDTFIAYLLVGITGLLSLLMVPHILQTRLMFHNAFSRGVLIDKLLNAKKSSKSRIRVASANDEEDPASPMLTSIATGLEASPLPREGDLEVKHSEFKGQKKIIDGNQSEDDEESDDDDQDEDQSKQKRTSTTGGSPKTKSPLGVQNRRSESPNQTGRDGRKTVESSLTTLHTTLLMPPQSDQSDSLRKSRDRRPIPKTMSAEEFNSS